MNSMRIDGDGSLRITGAILMEDGPRLHTRAVETQAGWVGQILVGDCIARESKPTVGGPDPHRRGQEEAQAIARLTAVQRLAEVFEERE